MARFTWQDGTLVSKAKVEIDGTIYEVDPEEYSGTTPLSASNLNAMQDGIYGDIGELSNLETDDKTNLVNAINSLLESTLYENNNGSNGTVVLSKAPTKKYLKIFYKTNNNLYYYSKVEAGNYFALSASEAWGNAMEVSSARYTINDITITPVGYGKGTVSSSSSYSSATNYIYITKILESDI